MCDKLILELAFLDSSFTTISECTRINQFQDCEWFQKSNRILVKNIGSGDVGTQRDNWILWFSN